MLLFLLEKTFEVLIGKLPEERRAVYAERFRQLLVEVVEAGAKGAAAGVTKELRQNMISELLKGDLILTRSSGWLSKSIRFFGKLMTRHARYSHAAISLGGRMIIEALWEVQINKLDKYEGKRDCDL